MAFRETFSEGRALEAAFAADIILIIAHPDRLLALTTALAALHVGGTITVSDAAALDTVPIYKGATLALIEYPLGWVEPLEALRLIQDAHPGCGSVLALADDQAELAAAALTAGLDAYLLRDTNGYPSLGPTLQIARARVRNRQAVPPLSALSYADQIHLRDALLDITPLGMAIIDTEFRYLYINRTLAAQNQRSVADHIGQKVSAILPQLGAILDPLFRQILATRTPVCNIEIVEHVPGADDQQRIWQASYYPLFAADGTATGIGVVATDITAQSRAATALRQVENRLQTIVASLPMVLFALDQQGIFTLAMGADMAVSSDALAALVGRSVTEISQSLPDLLTQVSRALQGNAFTATLLVQGHTFEVHYVPLRDATGKVVEVLGVATDITERQQLQEQLWHAQRLESIGRLAGSVAHDFNNLLTAISGYAELAMIDLPSISPAYTNLEGVFATAARATQLTKQLLTIARRQPIALRPLVLNNVVLDLAPLLRQLLGPVNTLRLALTAGLRHIIADVGQIEQVLVNLAVNARDAMPAGGVLTITTANGTADLVAVGTGHHAAGVQLIVADTGTGMDEAVLAQVFEPFFTTKAPDEGTGLGLATCYSIVQQHGGTIAITSALGVGTTVMIDLPMADD